MTMASPPSGPPGRYVNYPAAHPSTLRRQHTTLAMARGTLAGMATAAATTVAVLPSAIRSPEDSLLWLFLLVVYTVAAAVVGALPGALVGGLLSALARAGATSPAIRLAGSLAAVAVAATVSMPLGLASWPGTVIAALCGAFAAPAVTWGPYRPTLD